LVEAVIAPFQSRVAVLCEAMIKRACAPLTLPG
jgi:hypothetical protein